MSLDGTNIQVRIAVKVLKHPDGWYLVRTKERAISR